MNKEIEIAKYDALLKSGMFWGFYPELTGDYEKDKDKWSDIIEQLEKSKTK